MKMEKSNVSMKYQHLPSTWLISDKHLTHTGTSSTSDGVSHQYLAPGKGDTDAVS